MHTHKVVLIVAACMISANCGLAARDVYPGTVIEFDDRNSIYYLSTGPYEPGILLKIKHDGAEFDWPVDVTHDRVGVLIYDIQYMDKDNLWIFSRFGHAAKGVTLLNIPSRKMVKSYVGSVFTLSPDKKNVARLDTSFDRDGSLHASFLFVDDVLLYPQIRKVEFRRSSPTDEEYLAFEKVLFSQDKRLVDRRLFWKNGALIYALRDSNDRYEARSVDLAAPGEDPRMYAAPLSVRRSDLSQLTTSTLLEGIVTLDAFDAELSRLGEFRGQVTITGMD